METFSGGTVPGITVTGQDFDKVAGAVGQVTQPDPLRATIAVDKRMHGIDIVDIGGGLLRRVFGRKTFEIVFLFQAAKQIVQS